MFEALFFLVLALLLIWAWPKMFIITLIPAAVTQGCLALIVGFLAIAFYSFAILLSLFYAFNAAFGWGF